MIVLHKLPIHFINTSVVYLDYEFYFIYFNSSTWVMYNSTCLIQLNMKDVKWRRSFTEFSEFSKSEEPLKHELGFYQRSCLLP